MSTNWDVSGLRDWPEQEREPEIDWEPRRRRRRFRWPRGRRSRFGLITGLAALAVVGAFIWSGRDRTNHELAGETPMIRADDTPIKIPPESPGGMEIPHRDKLVYQRLPGGEPGKLERLLPPPEEPLPAPVPEPAVQPDAAPPSTVSQPVRRESLSEDANGETSSIFTQGDQPAPRPAAPANAAPAASSQQAPKLAQPANPQPSGQQANGPRPLSPQASPQTPAAQPSARTALTTPPRTPPQNGAGGGYMVQLVAVSSAGQAQGVWTSLRNRNTDLLGGMTPTFVRADLGTKGSIYRLRAGPVVSEERARAICAELVKRNVDCIIVRPDG